MAKRIFGIGMTAAVLALGMAVVACNSPTAMETRGVTVNVAGTGADGVTHDAPATIPQSATQLTVTLFDVPADATVTAVGATIAGSEVTFAFAAGESALTFEITVTAFVPTVILSPDSVTIADGNPTATVDVTGTATGDVTLDTSDLPAHVSATVSGTTITVTGIHQATAIDDTFTVGVTRGGVAQNLTVAANLSVATVIFSVSFVDINNGNPVSNVNVTGTATGAITIDAADLPAGVTATVSGATINVTGVRGEAAINGNFTLVVTRQGITQNLPVVVNLTPLPTVMLSSGSVAIDDGNLTASVNVTGTATGAVTLDVSDLPGGVGASVSGTTVTVTGVRGEAAIDGDFTVGVTRQGVRQNLSVAVNLTAVVAVTLPTTPGLFPGAPETLTPASTPIAGVAANDIAAAVNHANASGGAFTLLIDDDVEANGQLLNAAGVRLTIFGIGEERTIQYLQTGGFMDMAALFHLNHANASLTLGDNITLRGINNAATALVRVRAGTFTMLDGSKITGHTNVMTMMGFDFAAAVDVAGDNAHFIMEGGEITGNTHTATVFNASGGVSVRGSPRFTMSGGTISGNLRGGAARDLVLQTGGAVIITGFASPFPATIDQGGIIIGALFE